MLAVTMSSAASHSIKQRASPKDVFYTPEALAQIHIDCADNALYYSRGTGKRSEDESWPSHWLDPFYGEGVYYKNFIQCDGDTKDFTEIALGKDFFTYTPDRPVDVICSNPPYSCLDRVLAKCVELKPEVISLLLLHGAVTPKRMEFMESHGYHPFNIYHAKVFKWYGITEAWTWTKNDVGLGTRIDYDRIVYR
jgi:hypothetical protein